MNHILLEQAEEMLDNGRFVSGMREHHRPETFPIYHMIVKDNDSNEYQIIAIDRRTGAETVTWRYGNDELSRLLREHYIMLHEWTYERRSKEGE